jgi:leader peptidase (prepilin peptidase)/N-methyltransferase
VDTLIAAFVFLAGLVFGSFLNVCIYRIPLALLEPAAEESPFCILLTGFAAWKAVSTPVRSACPRCGHTIRWYDNLPLLSWLLLGRRCRDCGARISARYAAVESLTAMLFLACYLSFGLSLVTLKFCIFGFLLIGLIFTDAEHRLLPDAFTVPGVLLGLIFSPLSPVNDLATRYLPGMLNPRLSWRLLSFFDSLLGTAVGAGFIFGCGLAYRLARGREGMGLGDVKLMAMVGAFLGAKLTVLTIFAASILGSVFGLTMVPVVWVKRLRRRVRRNGETFPVARRRAWTSAKLVRYYAIPFGVFLGAVALFAMFVGNDLLRWYWRL